MKEDPSQSDIDDKHPLQQSRPIYSVIGISLLLIPIALLFYVGHATEEEANVRALPKTIELEIPAGTSARTAAIVNSGWPKMLNACPGIRSYIYDLRFKGIEDYMIDAPEVARVDIVFDVVPVPASIPAAFLADGNTCRFGISPDGMSLRIQKEACAAICTQGQIDLGGEDYVRPL